MEFYSKARDFISDSWRFQFPTGWNSTEVLYYYPECNVVCFNSQRDGILLFYIGGNIFLSRFQFPTGWNSTRFWYIVGLLNNTVSIPNGMEFYSFLCSYRASIICFNSQRDGILRCLRWWKGWIWIVSIPNGMEFYAVARFRQLLLYVVSIPNGMEFYSLRLCLVWEFSRSFNSQRDGILLKREDGSTKRV